MKKGYGKTCISRVCVLKKNTLLCETDIPNVFVFLAHNHTFQEICQSSNQLTNIT